MRSVPSLQHGHFLGEKLRSLALHDLTLAESAFAPGARLSRHRHELAFYCLVLEGGFSETAGRRVRDCESLAVMYRPPGEEHGQQFGARGGRCFNLELSTRWFERHRDYLLHLDGSAEFGGTRLPEIALRLYREFNDPDDLSALAIEALSFEMLAESVRAARREAERQPPHWLRQARELLHERFAASLTVSEVAAEVCIHPSQLARAFRQFYGCTVAEYVRRRRLEGASRALIETDRPLAAIAFEAGFCDQSHFTRTFRARTGATPAAFRALARRREPRTKMLG